jgi:hypothetical protein
MADRAGPDPRGWTPRRYVTGYLLKVSVTGKLPGLLADLLYTLGWALWTGVVVVVFFQIVPEAKTRQIERAADALEAVLRDQTRGGSGQEAENDDPERA